MDKESLIKVRNNIIKVLYDLDIDIIDKVELMININEFLDKDKYDDNVKILIKGRR